MSLPADTQGVTHRSTENLPAAVFFHRITDSLEKVGKTIPEGSSGGSAHGDAASSPEYREIMLLKVRLEMESARILSSAARLGVELVEAADGLRREAGAAWR